MAKDQITRIPSPLPFDPLKTDYDYNYKASINRNEYNRLVLWVRNDESSVEIDLVTIMHLLEISGLGPTLKMRKRIEAMNTGKPRP